MHTSKRLAFDSEETCGFVVSRCFKHFQTKIAFNFILSILNSSWQALEKESDPAGGAAG